MFISDENKSMVAQGALARPETAFFRGEQDTMRRRSRTLFTFSRANHIGSISEPH